MVEVPEHCWEHGWQGHEVAQLRRMARLPLWEKIRWLEDAARLAEFLRNQANPPSAPPAPVPIPNTAVKHPGPMVVRTARE